MYNGLLKYTYNDRFGIYITHKSLDNINKWAVGRISSSIVVKPTNNLTLAAKVSKHPS